MKLSSANQRKKVKKSQKMGQPPSDNVGITQRSNADSDVLLSNKNRDIRSEAESNIIERTSVVPISENLANLNIEKGQLVQDVDNPGQIGTSGPAVATEDYPIDPASPDHFEDPKEKKTRCRISLTVDRPDARMYATAVKEDLARKFGYSTEITVGTRGDQGIPGRIKSEEDGITFYFAIVPLHAMIKSLDICILRGLRTPQEHRNIPLKLAFSLFKVFEVITNPKCERKISTSYERSLFSRLTRPWGPQPEEESDDEMDPDFDDLEGLVRPPRVIQELDRRLDSLNPYERSMLLSNVNEEEPPYDVIEEFLHSDEFTSEGEGTEVNTGDFSPSELTHEEITESEQDELDEQSGTDSIDATGTSQGNRVSKTPVTVLSTENYDMVDSPDQFENSSSSLLSAHDNDNDGAAPQDLETEVPRSSQFGLEDGELISSDNSEFDKMTSEDEEIGNIDEADEGNRESPVEGTASPTFDSAAELSEEDMDTFSSPGKNGSPHSSISEHERSTPSRSDSYRATHSKRHRSLRGSYSRVKRDRDGHGEGRRGRSREPERPESSSSRRRVYYAQSKPRKSVFTRLGIPDENYYY